MNLYNLKKTCDACPSQWTAINEKSEPVYIRYRFDTLGVHCPFDPNDDGQTHQQFVDAMIFIRHEVYHDEYRGAMDTDEMLAVTGYTLVSKAI